MVSERAWEETWESLLDSFRKVAESVQESHPEVTWGFFHFVDLNEGYAFHSYASAKAPSWESNEYWNDDFTISADCVRRGYDDDEGTLCTFAGRTSSADEASGPTRKVPLVPEKEELARREVDLWLEDVARWLDENMELFLEMIGER